MFKSHIKEKEKIVYWSAFFTSLISLTAFVYYLIILSLSFQNILDNSTQTTYKIFAIDNAIKVWYVQIGMIFSFLTIPLNIYLVRSDFKKYFLLTILIFGNQLYFFKFLVNTLIKVFPSIKVNGKLKVGILLSSVSSFAIIPIIPFVTSRDSFYVDEPTTTYEDASFSLNPDTPNTIEFFEDGINPSNFLEDSDISFMDGFYIFDNTTTSSFMTQHSHSAIEKGEGMWDGTSNNSYRNNMFINHSPATYQKNYINILGMGRVPFSSYSAGKFGYAPSAEAEETDKDIHFLNFGQAREIQAQKNNGFSQPYAPITAIYETFINGMHEQDINNNEKPSHTYMQGELMHGPRQSHEDGTVGIFNTNCEEVNSYSRNMLARIIDKLKSIKVNPNDKDSFNAYDNTNIFIYGDHGSHSFKEPMLDQSFDQRKNRSLFMVKPAVTQHKTTETKPQILSDKYLWAPHIRNIINYLTSPYLKQLTDVKEFGDWINSSTIAKNFVNRPTISFGRTDSSTSRTPYFTTTQPYLADDDKNKYNYLVERAYDFTNSAKEHLVGKGLWFSIDEELGKHVFDELLKELKWQE